MSQQPFWKPLQDHYDHVIKKTLTKNLFTHDSKRFSKFSLQTEELFLDYSKNCITEETFDLLMRLADQANLQEKIQAMFAGEAINTTENRAALHTALRNLHQNNYPTVHKTLDKISKFVQKISGERQITDIVNLGIGGSDLGPRFATEALSCYSQNNGIQVHFVSNIDGTTLQQCLSQLNPDTCLFIISSKSFSTIETLTNAKTVKQWLMQSKSEKEAMQQFIAVTNQQSKALAFGISASDIFDLPDWVGGRYAIWSATALPLICSIGIKNFKAFLSGALAMDQHFQSAPFAENMPVIMALLGVWHINICKLPSQAIIPYGHCLQQFPTYLQQLDMESNGKHVTHEGKDVNYATAPIIWGGVGCNSQHAYHQALLQGTHPCPVDFILEVSPQHKLQQQHQLLANSCFSQSKAMMEGRTTSEIEVALTQQGLTTEEAQRLAPHKSIEGNIPSNTLLINQLNPYNLGMLIALYEHKVFVQAAIWDINPFDQWGVELGKQLLQSEKLLATDSSTKGLIEYFKHHQRG